jgi:DNA polymerase III alpha subunit
MRRDTSAARYRQGFVFLSLEDETGIVNVIVNPAIFHRNKGICVSAPYLLIKGVLQNTLGRGFGRGGPNRGAPRRSAGDDFA